MNYLFIRLIIKILDIFQMFIFIRVLLTWFPVNENNKFIMFLNRVTEPALVPARNLMNKTSMGRNMNVDISPILALLVISFCQSILMSLS